MNEVRRQRALAWRDQLKDLIPLSDEYNAMIEKIDKHNLVDILVLVEQENTEFREGITCGACDGSGWAENDYTCKSCNGSGKVEKMR
jgi:DnaJ-class molecular chaperone